MKKVVTIEIITYAFILLFVYTALSKWFMYPLYVQDLQRSPELGPYALPISIVIPASELIISGLLLFTRMRKWGLYGALLLMVLFTLYVAWVLIFSSRTPCSCGGIIRDLTWRQHLIFNIFFTGLAIFGIILLKKTDNNGRKYVPISG